VIDGKEDMLGKPLGFKLGDFDTVGDKLGLTVGATEREGIPLGSKLGDTDNEGDELGSVVGAMITLG